MSGWIAFLLPAGFAGLAWPWLLLALPMPWLVRWLAPPARSGAMALKVPWATRLDGIAAGGGGMGRARAMPLLAWAGWALLCIAATRPQGFGEVVQPPQVGRDLMLAVDLSGSMAEEDMRLGGRVVDRLTAAKAVLADFLDRREGDRVGLIVFGGRAYALAPLTLDRDTVRDQLLDSSVGLAGRETAIGDAIGLAVKRLRDQDAEQRVLVLLTDGVSNAGLLDPDRAARIARDEGVRIHTIAFGGDVQPLSMFGFRLPRSGADIEIDEAALERIATATGGRAFHARDAEELGGIYAEIDRLEPVQRAGPGVRPLLELYRWPLALALLCGALSLCPPPLPWRPRARQDARGAQA